jgi:copper chaperone CopZ
MQNLSYLLVILLLAVSCSSGTGKKQDVSTQDVSSEHVTQLIFDVEGMTCEGCEKAIMASVQKLEGIKEVTASHTAGESVVRFDSTLVSPELISGAIAAAGYTVTGFE